MNNGRMYFLIGVFDQDKVQIVQYVLITEEMFSHTKHDWEATPFHIYSEAVRTANKLNLLPNKPKNIDYVIVNKFKN